MMTTYEKLDNELVANLYDINMARNNTPEPPINKTKETREQNDDSKSIPAFVPIPSCPRCVREYYRSFCIPLLCSFPVQKFKKNWSRVKCDACFLPAMNAYFCNNYYKNTGLGKQPLNYHGIYSDPDYGVLKHSEKSENNGANGDSGDSDDVSYYCKSCYGQIVLGNR